MSLSTFNPQLSTRHVSTFNALHLGDNLIHLHFMRALAKKYPDVTFTHGAPDEHLAQLYPLWSDLPNLTVKSIAEVGQGAINAWRGAGGWFYQQPDQYDFLSIHLRWFRHLADLMGLESPIHCAADMLFDYPALHAPNADCGMFHVLVVNSPPMSGQWRGYSHDGFDRIIRTLYDAGHSVVTTSPSLNGHIPCTRDQGMDITAIGRLSQRCTAIIGCVTGPLWVTLSAFHDPGILRIHLLDHERVDLAPNTVHANSLSLVPEILKDRGLL